VDAKTPELDGRMLREMEGKGEIINGRILLADPEDPPNPRSAELEAQPTPRVELSGESVRR
jgi:hypothetical protein